jgi:hypothetical protein
MGGWSSCSGTRRDNIFRGKGKKGTGLKRRGSGRSTVGWPKSFLACAEDGGTRRPEPCAGRVACSRRILIRRCVSRPSASGSTGSATVRWRPCGDGGEMGRDGSSPGALGRRRKTWRRERRRRARCGSLLALSWSECSRRRRGRSSNDDDGNEARIERTRAARHRALFERALPVDGLDERHVRDHEPEVTQI